MKKKIFTFFILLALCSCKKQNEIVTLPADKLYILEYRYSFPEDYDVPWALRFHVEGFCELDSNFNLKYTKRVSYCDYYENSQSIVPDSIRDKISNVLLKYQTDTTFPYPGELGFSTYSGNHYRFIMQKHNQKDITIKFEPGYLPEDLKFVYSYLYENREKTVHKSTYNELFETFRNRAKDDEDKIEFPPPPPWYQGGNY